MSLSTKGVSMEAIYEHILDADTYDEMIAMGITDEDIERWMIRRRNILMDAEHEVVERDFYNATRQHVWRLKERG